MEMSEADRMSAEKPSTAAALNLRGFLIQTAGLHTTRLIKPYKTNRILTWKDSSQLSFLIYNRDTAADEIWNKDADLWEFLTHLNLV